MTEEGRIYFQDAWPSELGTECFGCGRNNENGLQIKSYWEDDEAICEWQPKDYHKAFLRNTCGGIITTVIDCHCTNTAIAYVYKLENRKLGTKPIPLYVTGSISVKLIKPTPLGRPLRFVARIKEMTERKIITTCDVFYRKRKTAEGEVTLIKLKIQQ
jgi:acyl-coenzyme A thioesterase PaaI-like protein